MAEYLSPGVYIEEFDAGAMPMETVGTDIAGFIGLAEKGPVSGAPQLVTSIADFRKIYGGYLSENEYGNYRFLAYAVEHFFVNGGRECFISRVVPEGAKQSMGFAPSGEKAAVKLAAKNPGVWGNRITVSATPSSKAKTQILEVTGNDNHKKYRVKNGAGFLPGDIVAFTVQNDTNVEYNRVVTNQDNMIVFENKFMGDIVDTAVLPTKVISTCEMILEVRCDDISERYEDVSFNISTPNHIDKKIEKSCLIIAEYIGEQSDIFIPPFDEFTAGGIEPEIIVLSGGSDGSAGSISSSDFIGVDNGIGKRTGIQSFLDNNVVSIMAVPGVTDISVQLALVAHCENLRSRFAILDMPRDTKNPQDIIGHRTALDSTYAAFYHPWLEVFDPLNKKEMVIPPSASIAGIYARTDAGRGVHKAPANEEVRSCVNTDHQFNKDEQDILNPKGVNLIRRFPGLGIRVWGARTASNNSIWRYVNVRRLFIFIEESIKENIRWTVFENNDEVLWRRVERTVSLFLNTLWKNGALAGSSAEEAFFVNIGRTSMSQDDIDNGKLICEIGVALIKPAEFVIFRVTQKVNEPVK